MQVELAGYNCDAKLLELAIDGGNTSAVSDAFTPEVISAAYARISRDPRTIEELLDEACDEVEKARRSNENIIFKMGHASVAEHAVMNFNVVGISRLAIEYLERHRLCSYTEKSQRYTKLEDDYHVPFELQATVFETMFLELQASAVLLYNRFFPKLTEYFKKKHGSKKTNKACEGMAKEDARYVSLLTTTGQLGLTCSARNLELIARRCAANPLQEVQELGKLLCDEAQLVAPSLVRYSEGTEYDRSFARNLSGVICSQLAGKEIMEDSSVKPPGAVSLVSTTPTIDSVVGIAYMRCVFPEESYSACAHRWGLLSPSERRTVFKESLKHLEFYDAAPREFEFGSLTFDCCVSASCYAQLKRHRMCSQIPYDYDPLLAPVVPESIEEAGLMDEYLHHAADSASLYKSIYDKMGPKVAEYVLTNGHRRRVLVEMNMREMYHFCRMRQDGHAQWEIRALANEFAGYARHGAPLTSLLLCGKDQFLDKVHEVYGAEWAEVKKRP